MGTDSLFKKMVLLWDILPNRVSKLSIKMDTSADGHTYDFAYGMNWSGIIHDVRVDKYK
jgi:hypothetical protein